MVGREILSFTPFPLVLMVWRFISLSPCSFSGKIILFRIFTQNIIVSVVQEFLLANTTKAYREAKNTANVSKSAFIASEKLNSADFMDTIGKPL